MNGYLEKRAAKEAVLINASQRITQQLCMDTAQIALHEMGWGYDRILKFSILWGELYNHYFGALERPANKMEDERDVYRHHLDEALRDILKDKQELIPFLERYPDAGLVTYDKK